MKKILALLLTIVLCFSFTACGKKQEVVGGKGGTWDCVEYDSLEELNAVLGTRLSSPGVMGTEDLFFGVISNEIAEYKFSVNGVEYSFRASPTYDKDISGVYVENGTAFEGKLPTDEIDYFMDKEYKLARWATIDGQYVICANDNGAYTVDQFETIALSLQELTAPGMSTAELVDYYKSLEGEYFDRVSERAVAEVTAADDHIDIEVAWGNSTSDIMVWTMSARLGDDGLLSYYDETVVNEIYDNNGLAKETVVSENGEGSFYENEGVLYWTGAADENCQACEFEKAQ